MEFYDPSKRVETKRKETGVAEELPQVASRCGRVDCCYLREIARVTVQIDCAETDSCSHLKGVQVLEAETDSAAASPTSASCSDSRKVPRVKTEADFAETDSCTDPSDVPKVKVETDVAASPTPSASKVKMEIDIAAVPALSASCGDSRSVPLPRVKAEADIAVAPVPSVSGHDMMDCFQSDSSHASQVKIEIDVAEETPLSWAVQDPMKSELSTALQIYIYRNYTGLDDHLIGDREVEGLMKI